MKVNDTVQLAYYTSKDLKTLKEDTLYGKVVDIVPLAELFADKTLSAEFPGLSNVESCTDWDSDLPINMDLITKEDEDYWEQYRSTPKVIVAYQAVCNKWSNSYGNATAMRTSEMPDLSELNAAMFGLQIIHPREIGLSAARNGVDFASLFLSLGFFIILAALLLMFVPLSEMISQRCNEINLYKALGFPKKRIKFIIMSEATPVVLISALVGVIAGLLYTWVVLLLLGSLWKGATQTNSLTLFVNWQYLLLGFVVSVSLCLLLLNISIGRILKQSNKSKKLKQGNKFQKLILVIVFTLTTLSLILINIAHINSAELYSLVGIMLIATVAVLGNYIISNKGADIFLPFSYERMVWASLYHNRKQALLSFFTLTVGVFIVFSVGLNRQGFANSTQLQSGTGGYSLWCESSIPIYHNMATQEGQSKLALTDLPENVEILQMLCYSADDASCLNLNKVIQPSVLGVDMNILQKSNFEILRSIYPNETPVFEAVQTINNSAYPALIDETVLTWGLMMKIGDTITYTSDNGRDVHIQIAGTLHNSIFQGNILIDKKLFADIWGETTGSEIALLRVNESEIADTKQLLSQALNEYGVKVTTTLQRLKEFYSVTDTYLTIFLTLGGLGLLLGIMSFIIVVRKSLASRREQICLYRSLGFSNIKISSILIRENKIIPLCAIVTGVVCSLIGVSTKLTNISVWIWFTAILFIILLISCLIIFIHSSVKKCLLKN